MTTQRVLLEHTTHEQFMAAEDFAVLLSDLSTFDWEIVEEVSYSSPTFDDAVKRHNVIARIQDNEFDELWVSNNGDEWATYWNSPRVFSALSIKEGGPIGSSYGNTLHHLAHRTEIAIAKAFGSWNNPYGVWDQTPSILHDWDRFTATYMQLPGIIAGLGSGHTAPNGVWDPGGWDYECSNAWPVWSTADAWEDYPDLSLAPPSRVDRDTWGPVDGDYERGYLIWWFKHLPHNPGSHFNHDVSKVIENDWWKYIVHYTPDAVVPDIKLPWQGFPKVQYYPAAGYYDMLKWFQVHGRSWWLWPEPWNVPTQW